MLMPTRKSRVAGVDVLEAPGLAVAAEGLLQRLAGGRRAEPGVPVEVVRADASPSQDGERVVVLDEELAGRVEADRARPCLVEQRASALDDRIQRRTPVGLDELAVTVDQRSLQAVRRVVRLPAVEALRAEATVVDAVDLPAADTNDLAAGDADVQGATVRAEDAGRLYPALGRLHRVLIDPDGPVPAAAERGSFAPDVANSVHSQCCVYPGVTVLHAATGESVRSRVKDPRLGQCSGMTPEQGRLVARLASPRFRANRQHQ